MQNIVKMPQSTDSPLVEGAVVKLPGCVLHGNGDRVHVVTVVNTLLRHAVAWLRGKYLFAKLSVI